VCEAEAGVVGRLAGWQVGRLAEETHEGSGDEESLNAWVCRSPRLLQTNGG
jgi:hypothetical protein